MQSRPPRSRTSRCKVLLLLRSIGRVSRRICEPPVRATVGSCLEWGRAVAIVQVAALSTLLVFYVRSLSLSISTCTWDRVRRGILVDQGKTSWIYRHLLLLWSCHRASHGWRASVSLGRDSHGRDVSHSIRVQSTIRSSARQWRAISRFGRVPVLMGRRIMTRSTRFLATITTISWSTIVRSLITVRSPRVGTRRRPAPSATVTWRLIPRGRSDLTASLESAVMIIWPVTIVAAIS